MQFGRILFDSPLKNVSHLWMRQTDATNIVEAKMQTGPEQQKKFRPTFAYPLLTTHTADGSEEGHTEGVILEQPSPAKTFEQAAQDASAKEENPVQVELTEVRAIFSDEEMWKKRALKSFLIGLGVGIIGTFIATKRSQQL